MLVRWPPSPVDLFSSVVASTSGDDGRFLFGGLAPGEYRILAVQEGSRSRIDRPKVLEYLLNKAEKLYVAEGQIQNLIVSVSEP